MAEKGLHKGRFAAFAKRIASTSGHPISFALALSVLVVWAVTGPLFHFNDTWQLVINTGTTIVTFLMVFLIQNTQNRDSAAVQVKLDELIRVIAAGNNELLDLEDKSEEEIEQVKELYTRLAHEAAKHQRRRTKKSA